jgi:hypothetical protein
VTAKGKGGGKRAAKKDEGKGGGKDEAPAAPEVPAESATKAEWRATVARQLREQKHLGLAFVDPTALPPGFEPMAGFPGIYWQPKAHKSGLGVLLGASLYDQEPTSDGASWVLRALWVGLRAAFDAAARLAEARDLAALDTNLITAIGGLVSAEVRRRLLLEVLRRNDYVLSHSAQELRIASGSAPLARMIRELGLADEVERRHAALGAQRGGRPRKTDPT